MYNLIKKKPILSFLFISIFFVINFAQAQDQSAMTSNYIAGLRPFERPANAPKITKFTGDEQWEKKMLKGIDDPKTGVDFVADQGAWYTPFKLANMPGRYDIRGMYQKGK